VLSGLKRAHKDQVFFPRWWSIFINRFYFSRKGLSRGVAKHAKSLRGTLLDFGCGAKPYARLFAVERHIGIDIKQSGHDHSDSKVDVYYDGHTIPFAKGQFDSIFASEVFEHLFNIDEILGELNHILKPGGHLLITVPFCWDQHEAPYDFGRYTEWGLTHLLSKHGFAVIERERSSTYIETVCQLFGIYFYKNIFVKQKWLSLIIQIFIVAPVFVVGAMLSKYLPDNGNLYLNQIVLARKR